MAEESLELSTGRENVAGKEGAELMPSSVASGSLGGDEGGVVNSSSGGRKKQMCIHVLHTCMYTVSHLTPD